jgi:hypothetical protein
MSVERRQTPPHGDQAPDTVATVDPIAKPDLGIHATPTPSSPADIRALSAAV